MSRARHTEPKSVFVERLGHDGDGCASGPRGSVFVRGALPGERVEIGKIEVRGSVARAPLLRVLEPSPERVAPACPIADRCGGCALMIASPALEASEKTALVARAFSAAGLSIEPEWRSPEPLLGYRVRARLSFSSRGGRADVGYREAASRAVIDVARCAVLEPRLASALEGLRSACAPLLSGRGEILLGLGAAGAIAVVRSEAPQPPALYAALETLVKERVLGGASLSVGGASVPASWGEVREQARDVDGRALSLSAGGFRQAHEAASAELARAVLEWSGLGRAAGERSELRVLELFSGHGNFTLPLAARAASVVAVEQSEDACAALRENLRAHGLEASVVAGDAAAALEKKRRASYGPIDVVVLDPPRAGAKDCALGIVASGAARVVYVSCEPRTLARDCAALVREGYVLEAVRAVNCFPRAASIEAVARLSRG